MESRRIYMDNAATTMVAPEVLEEMMPYFSAKYGNASSPHMAGIEARNAIDEARAKVARALGCEDAEIIFTSCGSESDNLAIVGSSRANRKKGKHVITCTTEHPAVLNTCDGLRQEGFEVTHVPVTNEGIIDLAEFENAIRKRKGNIVLVTIMHANNEIGSVQPIAELAKIAHENGALFHTDAVQSVGKIDTGVKALGVDMLALSGHKIHGPKGVAALYVRKGTKIEPIIRGGGHEWNLRSGTENVPGIVGMGKAIEMCDEFRRKGGMEEVKQMRDALIKGVGGIPDSMLNGGREPRLPNNANFSFEFIEGEGLLLLLDSKGIMASTGSACSSHSLKPSHVLLAIGRSPEQAHGSLRLTLSRYNKMEEVKYVLEELPNAVERLRAMSPFKKREEVREFEKKYATDEDEHEGHGH